MFDRISDNVPNINPEGILKFVDLVVYQGIDSATEETLDSGAQTLMESIDYISLSIENIVNNSIDELLVQVPFNSAVKIFVHHLTHLIIESLKPKIRNIVEKLELELKSKLIGDIHVIKTEFENFMVNYTKDHLLKLPLYLYDEFKYYENKFFNIFCCRSKLKDEKLPMIESDQYIYFSGVSNIIFE